MRIGAFMSGNSDQNTTVTERFIRLPELEQLVGFKRSTIYRMVAAKRLPAPIRLGPNTVAWRLSSVQRWMADIIESNQQAA
jgi:prophage regulatory protein